MYITRGGDVFATLPSPVPIYGTGGSNVLRNSTHIEVQENYLDTRRDEEKQKQREHLHLQDNGQKDLHNAGVPKFLDETKCDVLPAYCTNAFNGEESIPSAIAPSSSATSWRSAAA
ncbi:unnamed protein product, partial [Amoebophrya sp. A25]|eukprot:GSA25T00004527001.1